MFLLVLVVVLVVRQEDLRVSEDRSAGDAHNAL